MSRVKKPEIAPQNKPKPVVRAVSPEGVILESPTGESQWDIMSDGMARGYSGDSVMMRDCMRTPGALRRLLEAESEIETTSFPGMATLPNSYRINEKGEVTDPQGKVIKFNRKPDFGNRAPK